MLFTPLVEAPMRLTDLNPEFIHVNEETKLTKLRKVETLQEANGVMFVCPACYVAKGNTVIGAHRVLCFDPSVPVEWGQGPGRWPMTGTGLHDLTLTPSVLLMGGCGWHGFITQGEVSTC